MNHIHLPPGTWLFGDGTPVPTLLKRQDIMRLFRCSQAITFIWEKERLLKGFAMRRNGPKYFHIDEVVRLVDRLREEQG